MIAIDREAKQSAVDANYEAFKGMEADLSARSAGRFALLHNRSLIDVFDTFADAERTGKLMFEDQLHSVQQIAAPAINLGYFSYAVPEHAAQQSASADASGSD